jgi:uncharacterized protein
MKKLIIFAAIILAATAVIAHSFRGRIAAPSANSGLEKRSIMVGSVKLTVEVAATAAEQRQGLSDRSSLESNSGMLFPLVDPSQNGFWMKDMKFPLDFIYFDQGHVVETKENVPTAPVPLPFFPKEAVDAVLEVNAGYVAAHGVKVGDLSDY